MGVLAPLVKKAHPALVGGGHTSSATEGSSWQWRIIGVTDDAGAAINLTTVTGVCTVYDEGASIATLTFAGASDGSFTVSLDESVTAGLAAGADTMGRRHCTWGLTITDGTDVVQVWTPTNSRLAILKAAF